MAKGNPNDESMKLNFIPKVWDDEAKEFKPFYIAPDSTDKVRGDVYLSDDFSESDAATGVTAATPKLLSTLRDAYINSATESAEAAKAAAEAAQAAAESAKNIADNSIQKNDPSDQKIQGSIIPTAPGTQSLGTEDFPWGNIYGTLKGNADTATEAQHAKLADKATTTDKAITADTATKLGTATIGGVAQGIYLNLGVPTAKNANIGSAYLPSYLKGGIDTVCTSPSLLVNLGVGTAANIFAQDPRPGVTGVLPIANGGTGKTNAADARTALGLGTIATLNSPLPIANGGTGKTTVAEARTALGLGTIATLNSPLPIANGGTGATAASAARTNLGLGSLSTYSLPTGIDVSKLFINGAGQWVEVKTSGGVGGSTFSGTDLSAKATTVDASASSGKVILVSSPSTASELAKQTLEVPFGNYSIVLRAKVSNITDTTNKISIVCYAGTVALKTVNIRPNMFSANNVWCPIGIGLNFAHTAAANLVIVINSLVSSGASTMSIDSLTVMTAPVAVNAIG